MDVFRAEELITKLNNHNLDNTPKGLIVTENITELISAMTRRCSGTTKSLQNGLYTFITGNDSFLIGTETLGIPCGTYLIIKTRHLPKAGKSINIGNKEYELIDIAGVLLTV
jgi:hypothetical protein